MEPSSCPTFGELRSRFSTVSACLDREAVDPSSTQCSARPLGLYDLLVLESLPPARPAILFGWWPRSSDWTWKELVQCSTKCLPAVRAGLDFVALPLVQEVQDMWQSWRREHGIRHEQALWFEPRLDAKASQDPALEVCREVLSLALAACKDWQPQPDRVHFCPFGVTPDIATEAACRGILVIGDPEEHCPLPPTQGSAWQHPRISSVGARSEGGFIDALPPDLSGVRGLKGYVAESLGALRDAWRRLRAECPPGTRFLLRPVEGSGCGGAIADVQEEDLDTFEWNPETTSLVVEEMLAEVDQLRVQTLNMIGNTPFATWADEDEFFLCAQAGQQINKSWGLTGQWSLDFVREAGGVPVIVGASMGYPSSSFAVQLWASRALHPMALFSGSWDAPSTSVASIEQIMEALASANLLWDGDEGVLIYQHVPGTKSAFAVVSSFGDKALELLHAKFSNVMLSSFGVSL
eukprot:CAMPEP_0179026438 /NCGR_PEP_ID=MMETSP0796-20121207/8513_1 /TAXON_ID=73915 /ORGANISM="Pyrodinium bahamense, Strain pbaha01" /LENGTH=464 /DNA_ID=CAMNT_0020722515 /DNA_START=138 /DNA_END=1532 /DNA_ORIENTATION=+